MNTRTFLACLTLGVGLTAPSTAFADNGSNTHPRLFNEFDHNNDGEIGKHENKHATCTIESTLMTTDTSANANTPELDLNA